LLPGVNTPETSLYPGFWTRDPAWLAEAGLVPADSVWGWIELLCATMNGEQSRRMKTGAWVPPFAVPDHIELDGRPIFYPGCETKPDDEQGGPEIGLVTEHDNQYWLTFTASAYARLSGRVDIGGQQMRTRAGLLPLWLVCDLAHHALQVDGESGCCFIREDRRQSDWGYAESVVKTGLVLFPTLLRIESCRKLAVLLDACGQEGRASAFRAQEARLRQSIVQHFLFKSKDETWLLSATGEGRVPDIWASAFAVHRGFLPGYIADDVATTLANGIRSGTTIMVGQVLHVPMNYGGCWPRAMFFRPGYYQNGAAWAYPVGWYVSAVARVDPDAARALFSSYMSAMTRNWNDNGVGCAYECVNPALGHFQNQGYLTSVAMPYAALREAGLLPVDEQRSANNPVQVTPSGVVKVFTRQDGAE
jgi:hypothetical protein